MWCKETCIVLLVVLGSAVPRRLYVDPWYEPTSGARLAPRAYSTAGGFNRDYATSSEEQDVDGPTAGAVYTQRAYSFNPGREVVTTAGPLDGWYIPKGRPTVGDYQRPGVEQRHILHAYLQPESHRSAGTLPNSVSPASGARPHTRTQPERVKPSHEEGRGGTRRRSDGTQVPAGNHRRVDVEMRIVTSKEPQRRSPAQEGDSSVQHVMRPKPPHPSVRPTNKTKPDKQEPKKQPGDIVFPDNHRPYRFVPRGGACTKEDKGATFCESTETDYPADHIRRILKNQGQAWSEFLGQDVVLEPNVTQRIDLSEESTLCPSVEHVIFPKEAKNSDDQWQFIVNLDDKYKQGVRVETCIHTNACQLTEGFPFGYKTYCKQKYIYRKLLAINDEGKAGSDFFKLPSCCACFYTHDTNSRMAVLAQSKMTPAVTPAVTIRKGSISNGSSGPQNSKKIKP